MTLRALVSDDSEQYHYETRRNAFPASSMVGVAGLVAEWLSLGERVIFQSVSQIISFQIELELGREVWDSLEDDSWTLLGKNENSIDAKHRVTLSPILKADVHKSLLELIWSDAKRRLALWHVLQSLAPRHLFQVPESDAPRIVRTVAT